jgi:hypothetical protein
MARTLEPVAPAGRVVFELDRFELANEDQYQLLGRWFGVRGRRFIRPTLTVTVHDQSIRLLADLDDKPWAPEDGVPWRAAFPSRFEADEVQQAELTVAPDITIELRVAGSGPGQKAKAPSKPAKPKPPAPAEPAQSASTALRHELAAAQRRQDQLTRQLDRSEADRTHTAARLDELLGNLSEALQDRDQAQAARDEALGRLDELARRHGDIALGRDAALGERDAAVKARDAAEAARDTALEERDAARLERDAARQERDAALADRSAAVGAQMRAESERDTAAVSLAHAEEQQELAQTLLEQAQIERDQALAAHHDAVRERESIRGTVNQLNSEMAQHASSRGAAMVMRRATQEPAAFRTHTPLLPRAMAVIFMMAIVVVLLIVLHVA